jgi:DNA-binding phage protein
LEEPRIELDPRIYRRMSCRLEYQFSGGIAQLARDTNLQRENFYTMLSERGNPVLRSLTAILDALDLRLSVVRKDAA